MELARRLHDGNAGAPKRDDDLLTPNNVKSKHKWPSWRGPRRRRLFFGVLVALLLYLFFKNIPTDLPPVSQRIDPRYGRLGVERLFPLQDAVDMQQPVPLKPSSIPDFDYDGPVNFYRLSPSLVNGGNKNADRPAVLFAVSSLRTASKMLGMACEMAQQQHNDVHVLFVGRDETPLEYVKELNNLAEEECKMHWHDGRPDYAAKSSDKRMSISVRAALRYVYSSARPKAVIFDDSSLEDERFQSALRNTAEELHLTPVPIPSQAFNTLRWLTRLDGAAISHWNKFQIEAVIHPPADSSASLIRLLKSLQRADFRGLPVPKITIELPAKVDPYVLSYLSTYRWPNKASYTGSMLTIRRQTNPRRHTPITASLRTVESFYPANLNSHILLLNPDSEVSPLFYHYLVYLLLEYKYSATGGQHGNSLLGIALDRNPAQIDGFAMPNQDDIAIEGQFYLSGVPNSNAALYFGDKWAEFHTFLSHRLTVKDRADDPSNSDKLVSTRYPAFMEFLLELSRARGYFTLYAAVPDKSDSSLVTVHHELYQPPEEFLEVTSSDPDERDEIPETSKRHSILEGSGVAKDPEGAEQQFTNTGSLLSLLSAGDANVKEPHIGLPALAELPVFSYQGARSSLSDTMSEAEAYRKEFALKYGGCEGPSDRLSTSIGGVDELFCLPSE